MASVGTGARRPAGPTAKRLHSSLRSVLPLALLLTFSCLGLRANASGGPDGWAHEVGTLVLGASLPSRVPCVALLHPVSYPCRMDQHAPLRSPHWSTPPPPTLDMLL